jgi:hypothetical protein
VMDEPPQRKGATLSLARVVSLADAGLDCAYLVTISG